MSVFTNPFVWAAGLIDGGFSVQDALRRVGGSVVADFMLEVSKGRVPGHSVVNKFGASASVADGVAEEVWDGAVGYTWPTSASIDRLWSAADSALTRDVDVEIQGLDAGWNLVVQTVTTDASDSTTEVALTTDLARVFRMKVLDGSVLDEDLRVGPAGGASFQAQITAGNNQTLMAIYTVPNGYTGYVRKYYGSIIGEAGPPATLPDYVKFRLWQRDNANLYAPQLKHEKGAAMVGSSTVLHEFDEYHVVPEKNDIWIEATPDGDDAYVSAGFGLILVEDGF